MVRGSLAQLGVVVFSVSMIVPTVSRTHTPSADDVVVAAAFAEASASDSVSASGLEPPSLEKLPTPGAGAEFAAPIERPEEPLSALPAHVPLPSLEPPPTAGIVVASWYGPGFYGNRTACGQTYTPEIMGVAHRTLRCGTLVTVTFRGTSVTVPVIDRGPYIPGRALDLSNATRLALACTDLCTVSMRIGP